MLVAIICLSLSAVLIAPAARADVWDKKTVMTFSQPVELPDGIILPAGTYVFKLMNSLSNRHIVQVFNEEQTHLFATIFAIPNWRMQVTDETVVTFGEKEAGVPQTIRAWFYPGANSGDEFVYLRQEATQMAKTARAPVSMMPAELRPVSTRPAEPVSDEPVVASKEAPDAGIKPIEVEREASVAGAKPAGPEDEIAQVAAPPSPAMESSAPERRTTTGPMSRKMNRLPRTASLMPLVGLLGLLSLSVAMALWVFPKLGAHHESARFPDKVARPLSMQDGSMISREKAPGSFPAAR
ncbi:MAG: hypothetical protein ACKV2V_13360 [Blastocatellia bacterium]